MVVVQEFMIRHYDRALIAPRFSPHYDDQHDFHSLILRQLLFCFLPLIYPLQARVICVCLDAILSLGLKLISRR